MWQCMVFSCLCHFLAKHCLNSFSLHFCATSHLPKSQQCLPTATPRRSHGYALQACCQGPGPGEAHAGHEDHGSRLSWPMVVLLLRYILPSIPVLCCLQLFLEPFVYSTDLLLLLSAFNGFLMTDLISILRKLCDPFTGRWPCCPRYSWCGASVL